MKLVIDSCQLFQSIEKKEADAPRRSEVFPHTIFPSGSSRAAAGPLVAFFFFEGSRNNLTVSDLCMSLLEKKLDFTYLILCTGAGNQSVHALIITADDLLAGSLLAYFIVNDAVTCHVDTHICRRFI